jgi:hypothetical protein
MSKRHIQIICVLVDVIKYFKLCLHFVKGSRRLVGQRLSFSFREVTCYLIHFMITFRQLDISGSGEPRKTAKWHRCLPRDAKRPATAGDVEEPGRAFWAMRVRWSAPCPGELGVWAASDVTGTLAAYEL